jgi:hypothetical protein
VSGRVLAQGLLDKRCQLFQQPCDGDHQAILAWGAGALPVRVFTYSPAGGDDFNLPCPALVRGRKQEGPKCARF